MRKTDMSHSKGFPGLGRYRKGIADRLLRERWKSYRGKGTLSLVTCHCQMYLLTFHARRSVPDTSIGDRSRTWLN
jgi:hypothetical protein